MLIAMLFSLRYHGERNRHHNEPFSHGTLAPQSVPLQEILFLDILDYWPRTGCRPVVGKKAPGCGDNRDERSCAGIGLLRRWRNSGGGGGGSIPGTPPGTYDLTLSGTSGSTTYTMTITLKVT